YEVVLSTDSADFGGFGNVDETTVHCTQFDPLYSPKGKEWLKLYLPARTAQVLRLKDK
ncbi:MAG: alpha amylase C-terminal domain-containing protein, partial [Muribaculaceae bacterium]|nr:alpha amylase C-terminal domain-containing protein [Muribaculaceae bacterium]